MSASACLRTAAITEVTSSGMEEPTATIVSPMMVSDIPMLFAMAIEPLPRQQRRIPPCRRGVHGDRKAWTGCDAGVLLVF